MRFTATATQLNAALVGAAYRATAQLPDALRVRIAPRPGATLAPPRGTSEVAVAVLPARQDGIAATVVPINAEAVLAVWLAVAALLMLGLSELHRRGWLQLPAWLAPRLGPRQPYERFEEESDDADDAYDDHPRMNDEGHAPTVRSGR